MSVTVKDSETAAKLEELARKESFFRFEQHVLFSLTVWKTDEGIQDYIRSPIEWIKECANTLQKIVKEDSDGR